MTVLSKRRVAIDVAQDTGAIAALLAGTGRRPDELRPDLLAALKDALADGRARDPGRAGIGRRRTAPTSWRSTRR